jgi:hypothetical protein
LDLGYVESLGLYHYIVAEGMTYKSEHATAIAVADPRALLLFGKLHEMRYLLSARGLIFNK